MNTKAYFALEKKIKNKGIDVERSELVETFTEGAKTGISQLSNLEFQRFLKWLKTRFNLVNKPQAWQHTPENQMRRKLFAIFVHKMGYSKQRFLHWVETKGKYKKPLNQHTYYELIKLVSQAEIVLQKHLEQLRK